jgi:hypothetical protein
MQTPKIKIVNGISERREKIGRWTRIIDLDGCYPGSEECSLAGTFPGRSLLIHIK